MARSDDLLIIANRLDAIADDVGHGLVVMVERKLWDLAKEIRQYVREG